MQNSKLINEIKKGLGGKLNSLRRNEDDYQTFWVGVLEAMPKVNPDRPAIPYLISSGYGAIKNSHRSEMSVDLASHCEKCGVYYGFRTKVCPICKSDLKFIRRMSTYEDYHEGHHIVDPLDKVMFEQFISTLEGKQKYIAKRWMIDRADIWYENHSKQIAFELGISAPAVARHKKIIRQEFLRWYHNG